jgi:hypothetical protein
MSDLFVDNIKHQSSQGSGTITIGASGETISIPSGATLTVPSGGLSGQNYPAFEASLSANQNVSDATATKANCNTENFDTDNCYDNATNYRFTPTTAGKYFVYGQIATNNNTVYLQHTQSIIKKNGTTVKFSRIYDSSGFNLSNFIPVVAIVNMNGTTDYLELFGAI